MNQMVSTVVFVTARATATIATPADRYLVMVLFHKQTPPVNAMNALRLQVYTGML